MERKFRIIEELWYDNEFNEKVIYYVQEWKRGFFGKWKWRYWKKWCYEYEEKRKFKSIDLAKEKIDKYVKKQPHKIVVEELAY